MVDCDMQYANVNAQNKDTFSPEEDFEASVYTKAMLWTDLEDCVPLATAILY